MTTNPPEGTPDPGAYPPPDSPTPPQTPPSYQAPGYGSTPPPVYGQPAYAAPLSPSDERLWATLAHVGGIVIGFIAPLIVWLVFRERSGFVNDQAKEALNFQILITIAYVVGSILLVILIGGLIMALAWLAAVIFGIMGAIAANKGELYRYPFNWRIIK